MFCKDIKNGYQQKLKAIEKQHFMMPLKTSIDILKKTSSLTTQNRL